MTGERASKTRPAAEARSSSSRPLARAVRVGAARPARRSSPESRRRPRARQRATRRSTSASLSSRVPPTRRGPRTVRGGARASGARRGAPRAPPRGQVSSPITDSRPNEKSAVPGDEQRRVAEHGGDRAELPAPPVVRTMSAIERAWSTRRRAGTRSWRSRRRSRTDGQGDEVQHVEAQLERARDAGEPEHADGERREHLQPVSASERTERLPSPNATSTSRTTPARRAAWRSGRPPGSRTGHRRTRVASSPRARRRAGRARGAPP